MNELNRKEAARRVVELLMQSADSTDDIANERAQDAADYIGDAAAQVLKEMGTPEEDWDDAIDEVKKTVRYVPEHYEIETRLEVI